MLRPMLRPTFFALPLILLPFCAQNADAQPPDAPSTIKKPAVFPGFPGFVPPPDPPLITPEELQTLTGGPTLVTLSGRDLSLEDVKKALFEAARLPQPNFGFPDEKQTLTVDWNNLPFWSAAADVEKQTKAKWSSSFRGGLALHRYGPGSGVGLDGQIAAQTPLVTLVANSISRTTTLTTLFGTEAAPPARPDMVQIALAAYFDPKLPVQNNAIRSLKLQKQGEDALVVGQDNRMGFGYNGGSGPMTQVNFSLPQTITPGTTFSRISGILHNEVVTATLPFKVPDLLATPTATQIAGAMTYEVRGVTIEEETLTVRVEIKSAEAGQNNRVFRVGNAFSSLRVRDAQGRELLSTRGSSSGDRGEFSFRLKDFKGAATTGPYSLDWPIVTQVKSLDVPFELRDVTVP